MKLSKIILYGLIIGGFQALISIIAILGDSEAGLTTFRNLDWVIHILIHASILTVALKRAGNLGLGYFQQINAGVRISIVSGLIMLFSYFIFDILLSWNFRFLPIYSYPGYMIYGFVYSLIIAIFTRAKQDLEPA